MLADLEEDHDLDNHDKIRPATGSASCSPGGRRLSAPKAFRRSAELAILLYRGFELGC